MNGIENVYDFENRLVRHGDVVIGYDGDGNRVAENIGGTITNYLVDTENPTGYAQVIDELQSGAVTRAYTYGLFRIDQTQQIEGVWTTHFYGYDGHGSVRQLLSPTGVVTDTYDYDAFGNLIAQTGTTPNIYLFSGEAYDSTLGLYYNRARYLDVRSGRFWGMDTYEGRNNDPVSLHKYLYASADPIDRRDPSGHDNLVEINLTVALYSALGSMATTTAFGAYAAAGTLLNLPRDFKAQMAKAPSAAVVGISASANVGRLMQALGLADTSVGAGAAVGLQFLSFLGGFEAVIPSSMDRIWGYSYWGASYSVPFGGYGDDGMFPSPGVTIWPGVNLPFADASLYTGFIWNLKNADDYKGPFYCTGGSFLLSVMGISISPNATLCSAENGVFSIITDATGLGGGGTKGSAGSSLTKYYFQGEWRRN